MHVLCTMWVTDVDWREVGIPILITITYPHGVIITLPYGLGILAFPPSLLKPSHALAFGVRWTTNYWDIWKSMNDTGQLDTEKAQCIMFILGLLSICNPRQPVWQDCSSDSTSLLEETWYQHQITTHEIIDPSLVNSF